MAGRLSATWKSRSVVACQGVSRHFSGGRLGGHRGWKNETPAGSQTEVFVYSPECDIAWPDQQLGVLSKADPSFSLPGHIGGNWNKKFPITFENCEERKRQADVLDHPTNKEWQAQVLHSAGDFIKFNTDPNALVSGEVLSQFPRLPGMDTVTIAVHDAPILLRKEFQSLFPDQNLSDPNPLSVLTISQKTEHDMSKWSSKIEEEREEKTEHFVQAAKEMCGRLREEGYWSDFIDPASGTPYYSGHTNSPMFETDERYRLLGFRIEDLGCCKVICHAEYGRHVFVGCIITNAPKSAPALDDILEDLSSRANS